MGDKLAAGEVREMIDATINKLSAYLNKGMPIETELKVSKEFREWLELKLRLEKVLVKKIEFSLGK